MDKKIQVLIVDDSAVVRQSLTSILESDPQIEVMGTAADPIIAVKKIMKQIPDVITLDIEMPRMDGLTFLRKIMSQHPIPVVVISSLTQEGTEVAMKALEYGASEIIGKPAMNAAQFFNESKIMLCDAVKAASQAKLSRLKISSTPPAMLVKPKYNADIILERATLKSRIVDTEKMIVLGASTGGTEAIRLLLKNLPPRMPGIAIVQHMPEGFTRSFANSLNANSELEVKEAEDGDRLYQGRVLIAPGNCHMLLKRTGKEYSVEIKTGPLVNRHRPSVDVLFRSAARYAGQNATGILLTGMGADGAKGLLELKEAGADTIAQDQATSVVYGMPKEAAKLGAANDILAISEIAPFLVKKFF
ncbi:protein-glutamate methylesterase/protein-glutamine glutaminase [Geofilum rubicundum]|uniref:Protein-glutamate methylesterase/protein-glutamine glutaminase n=1 Tax=Geofilum rubicundum JCM 15548 TaxID=1236989 RepID=A0A0E9M1Y2_9BACT|nr:chemotaxis response regulator protein-glutamate methylesterase [Geofilum rubicundum]GAO31772.1 chemotaxis response regulator protein-glutamate methylesterase CheB [Geofilum rubicundum JCM 15548]